MPSLVILPWSSPWAILIYLLGAIVLTGSLFQLIKFEKWWVRFFDFPHLQFTVVNAALIAATFIFFQHSGIPFWVVVILLGAALVYQLSIIYSYTPLASTQVKRASKKHKPSLKLLEANVYQYNDRFKDLVRIVNKHDPQLIITLETDERWRQGMKPLEEEYPYNYLKPTNNTYGICIYSKLKMENIETRELLTKGVPSIRMDLYLDDDHPVSLFIVHPEPPAPQHNPNSTERDAELVLIGREVVDAKKPILVTGDLNDVAWSHTTRLFSRISGLLDPRIGRGFFNSFQVINAMFRWPLDHIFVSDEFKLKRIQRLERFGSDHFPMLLELTLEPENEDENQDPEQPDREDVEEANEKVSDAQKDPGTSAIPGQKD